MPRGCCCRRQAWVRWQSDFNSFHRCCTPSLLPAPVERAPSVRLSLLVVVSVHTSTSSTLVFCLQQFAHKDARFLHVWALRISESTPPGALRSLHTAAADLLAAYSLPMQMHRESNRRKRGVSLEKILILCDALPLFSVQPQTPSLSRSPR